MALKYIPLLAGIPRSSAAQMAKLDILRPACRSCVFTQSETGSTSGNDSTMLLVLETESTGAATGAVSQFTELEAEAVRINEEMKHG